MRLSGAHKHILQAMAQQGTLKSHRDIDGNKTHILHSLDGAGQKVSPAIVAYLADHGLIDSNKKFPAATYWLTAQGRALTASTLHDGADQQQRE